MRGFPPVKQRVRRKDAKKVILGDFASWRKILSTKLGWTLVQPNLRTAVLLAFGILLNVYLCEHRKFSYTDTCFKIFLFPIWKLV